jgi:hypothetical protein
MRIKNRSPSEVLVIFFKFLFIVSSLLLKLILEEIKKERAKMSTIIDVKDLVVHLHSNIESIQRAIQDITDTSSHDNEVSRLEGVCEERIVSLRAKHEEQKREIADRRRTEEAQLAEKRKREEDELMERRRREDEERRAKFDREKREREEVLRGEDLKREREKVENERGLRESAEGEIERLEREMEQRWEEGQLKVRELDEQRKV